MGGGLDPSPFKRSPGEGSCSNPVTRPSAQNRILGPASEPRGDVGGPREIVVAL